VVKIVPGCHIIAVLPRNVSKRRVKGQGIKTHFGPLLVDQLMDLLLQGSG
jgi:hypothetical protein